MRVVINPKKLSGEVASVASKSYAHRAIIAAALADKPTEIILNTSSEDIEATLSCIKALGAKAEPTAEGVLIIPIKEVPEEAVLDCGESGSTARFLIPVAAAVGTKTRFEGHGRLPERPQKELVDAITSGGAGADSDKLPMTVYGGLKSGIYEISGDVSSQYVTGLLFALATLEGDSEIRLSSPLQSAPYVDITLQVLEEFGIKIQKGKNVYKVHGGTYTSPGKYYVEGDWSNSAFWIVAAKTGNEVTVSGLNAESIQGDKAILREMWMDEIDASQIPDLVPVLAVCAAAKKGVTKIVNAGRLRIKESDRLSTVTNNLKALGGDVTELDDGLIINGRGYLDGGKVCGSGDHRIVMSMAIAATICKGTVEIEGAEAVNKSYPTFFEDYKKLGGDIRVL